MDIAVRYGVVRGFDLGAQCWWGGCELNATVSLIRGRVFDLALAPSVGVNDYEFLPQRFGYSAIEGFAKLSVLFGIRFGEAGEHELVFGPQVLPLTVFTRVECPGAGQCASLGDETGVMVGGLLGVSLHVFDGLRVMPELTVLTPATSFFGSASNDSSIQLWSSQQPVVFYQLGLGVSFGNDGLL